MNSTLLDRYLAEIARNLPRSTERDDIIAEISDELQSRIESGEGSEYDIIKAYGHPRVVAARYQSHQYLVGPALFPFYGYTLKIVLAVVLGVEIFGSALGAMLAQNPSLFGTGLGAVWSSVAWVVGVVTIIFALLERYAKGPIFTFDPSKLPSIESTQRPRYQSAFEFIANFCMLLLLLFGGSWVSHAIAPLAFTSAWQPAWYATVAATMLVCSSAFATYLSPAWTRARNLVQIVADVLMIVGASMMLRGGGPYFAQTTPMVDLMVTISIYAVIGALAIAGAVALWKLLPFALRQAQGDKITRAGA